MPNIKQPDGVTREAHNVVSFGNGQRFEVYASRILITDGNSTAQLELTCRDTEIFYDSNGTPLGREVYWPSEPKWSDGRSLSIDEATELAKKVKIANDVVGDKIQQIFEGNNVLGYEMRQIFAGSNVRAGGRYDFNSF